ncbi:mitochondrial genome maintenance MGM101-domain-containing protein [Fimicolochytrium jonesii]|uniref:mitochondrial genome maintenance MGM101-domain-containing protein n=1 Tax=Fimicolochytrium jonesii TaxID=1396493 RepID=UPI0022FE9AF3|nr:mitochondrial genome maintenance MGM101-domain-containing protein [Fimicolochytrium jonesii]KAI8825972.1 mitochondrial genome maintenance MGM101-domain-containing protein [Fimicolochytrium jonesii]
MLRITRLSTAALRLSTRRASSVRFLATQAPSTNSTSKPAAFPAATAFANETKPSKGDLEFNLTSSHKGLAQEPFPKEVAEILLAPLPNADIEVKPDGMIYLPEIKYRRILNRAFGPGAWGLIPRGDHTVTNRTISREYALFCNGRFVAQARGENDFFSEEGLATASEGVKSNALMRCCKDLGIASELWDPVFIEEFKRNHAVHVMTSNATSQARKMLWRRKDRKFAYPVKEETASSGSYTRKSA